MDTVIYAEVERELYVWTGRRGWYHVTFRANAARNAFAYPDPAGAAGALSRHKKSAAGWPVQRLRWDHAHAGSLDDALAVFDRSLYAGQ